MKTLVLMEGIERHHGPRAVLDGVTVAVGEGMRVAVVGRNGAGKSTLCRILTGDEEADGGRIVRSDDLVLGYLEQGEPWEDGETVGEFLVRRTGAEEWRCGRAAGRMGIKGEALASPIASLSGGWRTRVKLASMILADPNLLVLDEPTNFLDLSTQLLLEEFLRGFRGAAILVSHDREFLRRTTTHTLELERGRGTLFPGTVDRWFEERAVRDDLARRRNAAIKEKKERLQEFIDRFGAKNTKAAQAKSKEKEIARLDEEEREIAAPLPEVRLRLAVVEERKGVAFTLRGLAVGHGGHAVARDITLDIERGSRVAVVGDNGQGKTTILRTLADDLAPVAGSVKPGHGVAIAFYAQHVYEALDPADTVLSHLERCAPALAPRQDVLDMAGCFLFRGEETLKPVAVLSGGERARLCLAGLLLRRRTALVLDEPTNHLDFETSAALAAALVKFGGTVLFASHDRSFTAEVATDVLEVEAGRALLVPGGYGAYLDRLRRRAREAAESGGSPASAASGPVAGRPDPSRAGAAAAKAPAAAGGAAAWEERKRRRAIRAKAEADLRRAELRIATLERERSALHAALESDPADPDGGRYRRLSAVDKDLAELEEAWLDAQARLEGSGGAADGPGAAG